MIISVILLLYRIAYALHPWRVAPIPRLKTTIGIS